MTELPDDMEALQKWSDGLLLIRPENLAGSVRALLLAYQERGRALEPFAAVADLYSEITSDEAFIDQEDGVTLAECRRARTALNQKGKSHD